MTLKDDFEKDETRVEKMREEKRKNDFNTRVQKKIKRERRKRERERRRRDSAIYVEFK